MGVGSCGQEAAVRASARRFPLLIPPCDPGSGLVMLPAKATVSGSVEVSSSV